MEMIIPTREQLEELYTDLHNIHKRIKAMEARFRYQYDMADDEPWLEYDANLIEQTANDIQTALYPIERILEDTKNYPITSPLLQQ